MKINAVEIDLKAFGARLAHMDDKQQAEFFNGLGHELKLMEQSRYEMQLQFAYVLDNIDDDIKDELENVLTMLWYKEE